MVSGVAVGRAPRARAACVHRTGAEQWRVPQRGALRCGWGLGPTSQRDTRGERVSHSTRIPGSVARGFKAVLWTQPGAEEVTSRETQILFRTQQPRERPWKISFRSCRVTRDSLAFLELTRFFGSIPSHSNPHPGQDSGGGVGGGGCSKLVLESRVPILTL